MAETMESPGGDGMQRVAEKSGTRLLCATVDMQKERQWFLVCQEEGHCPKCELEKESGRHTGRRRLPLKS